MKDLFSKAKYDFIHGAQLFWKMKQVKIFDTDVYSYVYVDNYSVLKWYTDFVSKKPDAFEKLFNRKKDCIR